MWWCTLKPKAHCRQDATGQTPGIMGKPTNTATTNTTITSFGLLKSTGKEPPNPLTFNREQPGPARGSFYLETVTFMLSCCINYSEQKTAGAE